MLRRSGHGVGADVPVPGSLTGDGVTDTHTHPGGSSVSLFSLGPEVAYLDRSPPPPNWWSLSTGGDMV